MENMMKWLNDPVVRSVLALILAPVLGGIIMGLDQDHSPYAGPYGAASDAALL